MVRIIIKLLTVVQFSFLYSYSFASESKCKNATFFPSIKSLVEESNFIAAYRATSVTLLEGEFTCCRFQEQLYEASFEKTSDFEGIAPEQLSKRTIFPKPDILPISFFRINRSHKKLVENQDILFLWSNTGSGYSTEDGNCYSSPRVVLGYEYLVFGGVESPISVEPFLDAETDALVLEVRSILREKNSKYDKEEQNLVSE